MDDFEKYLSRQQMRSVPESWRGEILAQAEAKPEEVAAEPALPWWRQLFWPSPVVWSAVACAWVCIIGLNIASRPEAAAGSATADLYPRMMIARHTGASARPAAKAPPASDVPRDREAGPDAFIPGNSPISPVT